MRTRVVCLFPPGSVEEVGSVAAIWYTIIDKQPHNNIIASRWAEHYIFTPTACSIACKSIFRRGSITAIMLDETLRTDIFCMEFSCLFKLGIPSESTNRGDTLKECYRFIHCSNSFIGSDTNITARWCPNKTIEFSSPLLKLSNERCGVSSELIDNIKDISVDS